MDLLALLMAGDGYAEDFFFTVFICILAFLTSFHGYLVALRYVLRGYGK
jgi:hypothetical protein